MSLLLNSSRRLLTQLSLRNLSSTCLNMDIDECVKRLENLAPTSLAASFDNVGLLVKPPQAKHVRKMLLTNDLTLEVMEEALRVQANFILSYHPPIFKGLKRIGDKNWKEKIVGKCMANGIFVYSPHTSYDALSGGVNDWLISAFGMGIVSPIEQAYETSPWGYQIEFSGDDQVRMTDIGNQIKDAFQDKVHLSSSGPCSMKILINKSELSEILYFIRQSDTFIPASLAVTELMAKLPIYNHGMGRKKTLAAPVMLSEAVQRIKEHLNIPHVRLAIKEGGSADSIIQEVAVCAGAGRSVLLGVKADLYITGEMSHHDVLDTVHSGTSVILTEHSNCERGFLQLIKPRLSYILDNNVEIVISNIDKDPLAVV